MSKARSLPVPLLTFFLLLTGPVAGRANAQTLEPFAASFGNNSTAVNAVAMQADGRIVVGGVFQTAGVNCDTCTLERNRLARLLPDGNIDSFNPGANANVHSLAIQADQKILVGGSFTLIGGGGVGNTPRRCLARLNPNGTVDPSFDPIPSDHPGGCSVQHIFVQSDGRIIIVGPSLTRVKDSGGNSVVRQGIARLNPDGTADTSYYPGIGQQGQIRSAALDAMGRLILGGPFTTAGDNGVTTTPRIALARFLANGTLDSTFNPGVTLFSNPANVEALTVQPNGSILVGGFFNGIGGGSGSTTRFGLARLDDTGGVEAFNPHVALDALNAGTVLSIVLQADGRILVGGNFLTVGGIARTDIVRLESNGAVDPTFTDVIGVDVNSSVPHLTLQADGRIIVSGGFTSTNLAVRNTIARYTNTAAAVDSVVVTGGSTITWNRGGTGPEVEHVWFEVTGDGLTWTPLGAATRIAGGWEMTGLSLPANPIVRTWAVAMSDSRLAGSSSLLRSQYLPAGVNFVQNAGFSDGTTGWFQFATPDLSYIVSDVTNGVFRFYRRQPAPGTSNQALVFRETNIPIPANAALQATFALGNTDTVRKRISVLVHDSNFSDLFVCTFWLPANAPLQTYGITTHTTQTWSNATISLYAASANAAINTTGYYLVDDVSVTYVPGGTVDETTCLDPTAPTPPGGPAGPELLVNGDFASGALLPGWGTFGQITFNITGGVFQFHRPAGVPGGVILQPTTATAASGEILTASFQLGNTSRVRLRVTVIVHDNDFTDLAACTFWLPAAQPLSTYTMRTFTTKPWTNATLSVYPSTVGLIFWTQLDNASLRSTPGAPGGGVACLEPGSSLVPEPASSPRTTGRVIPATTAIRGTEPVAEAVGTPVTQVGSSGFRTWLAAPATGRLRIEVSSDGVSWRTLWVITREDGPVLVELDPPADASPPLYIRFVTEGEIPGGVRD